ncbi:esterase/lipase family protein [Pseudalkalibacillus hwajinpoensis]|uniref:esterase/lipase family protein n=1 Tax=Guptibacillus hwajinpoensis TaxID=208199 RepID=UPI00384EA0F5
MSLSLNIFNRSDEKENEVLTILIHGLSAPFTFVDEGRNWKETMLLDGKLAGVDIGIVTYDTGKLAKGIFLLGDGFTSIEELAQELKSELELEDYNQYKKIILVGHSMGGLIGIRYMLEEIKRDKPSKIKSFISLATPYNGSDKADFHKIIKWATPHKQIPQMEPNSKFISDTIRRWVAVLANPKLSDITFTFGYGAKDRVVPKESAIPHIQIDEWEASALDGDHTSILNIRSDLIPRSYKLVRDRIRKVINSEKKTNETIIEQSQSSALPVININEMNQIQLTENELWLVLEQIQYNVETDCIPAFNLNIESEDKVKQEYEIKKSNLNYTSVANRLIRGFEDTKNAIHKLVFLFVKDNFVNKLDKNNKIKLFRILLNRNLKNVVHRRIENINGEFQELNFAPNLFGNTKVYDIPCTDGKEYGFKIHLKEEVYKRFPNSGFVTDDLSIDIIVEEVLPVYLFYKYRLTYTVSFQWEVPDLYYFYFESRR